MIITQVSLKNFRNYHDLEINIDKGINIFHGDNAQGKTNFLEAVYVACTSKSHKSSRERDMISFGSEESHIKVNINKKDFSYRIDVHLKKNNTKGIAVNRVPLKRVSELVGIAPVVIFSPEDLNIIKNGPSERRRFMDMELCQLNHLYVHKLSHYTKVLNQKNKVLKSLDIKPELEGFLDVYNEQLCRYGYDIINTRKDFIERLNLIIKEKYVKISDSRENIDINYEPSVSAEEFSLRLKKIRDLEKKNKVSMAGPQKDDIIFRVNGNDLRFYGSQGQQRSAVLSLKLSEVNLNEEILGEKPVLLLDDVLSELDQTRQDRLLDFIGDIQTFITCTGMADYLNKRIHIDKIFKVKFGTISGEN